MTETANGKPLPEAPFGMDVIEKALPHRYPFLLVDRVLAYDLEEKTLTAVKNVTYNEPHFTGHFPGLPVMPGVLIIEAMAQAAGVLGALSVARVGGENLFYLAKIEKARFSQTVVPGDQLVMKVRETRRVRNMGLFESEAFVDGRRVARAEFMCAGKN